jgi:hypothetical protein
LALLVRDEPRAVEQQTFQRWRLVPKPDLVQEQRDAEPAEENVACRRRRAARRAGSADENVANPVVKAVFPFPTRVARRLGADLEHRQPRSDDGVDGPETLYLLRLEGRSSKQPFGTEKRAR